MLIYILQTTSKISEYIRILFIDRATYILYIFIFFILKKITYNTFIMAELTGRLVSFLYAIYICKDITMHSIKNFSFSFVEMKKNILVGSKLMFANIASLLIIGIVRFGIEKNWSVETFGQISLTITLSQLFVTFINAIGIILYPSLCNLNKKELKKYYLKLHLLIQVFVFFILSFYYPLSVFLKEWLPNYSVSLDYMAILFPLCLFECKMALLNNTYLKVLRKEKMILTINLITVLFSGLLTLFSTFLLKNLELAVISILFLIWFRCDFSEIYLSKELNTKINFDKICENILVVIFIISNSIFCGWFGFSIYIIFFCIYIMIYRNKIKNIINYKG